LLEAFGAGTAVIVSPVNSIGIGSERYSVPIDPKKKAGEAGFEGVRWSVEHPRGKDTSPMVKKDQLILRATDDGCKFIL
jgi:hypothetical protein